MLNLESAMLNALLDRYERSRGFKENRSQQRRIQLRMYVDGKTDFPAYDIEDSSARTAINEAAKKLAEQGVIELEWMHGQEGHILRRIALRPQALADAYHRGGRKPLADTAGQLAQRLRQVQQASSAPWARRYLQEELDFLEKNRRPRAAFPAEAAEQKDWLAVLEMLGTRAPEPPLLERVFSLRCLGNSKAFEKYHRARLLGVLRKALPLDTEEMNEEELLRQSGLEKYPEWFSFCGAVRLTWPDGKALDIAPLGDGVQISAVDARYRFPLHHRSAACCLWKIRLTILIRSASILPLRGSWFFTAGATVPRGGGFSSSSAVRRAPRYSFSTGVISIAADFRWTAACAGKLIPVSGPGAWMWNSSGRIRGRQSLSPKHMRQSWNPFFKTPGCRTAVR